MMSSPHTPKHAVSLLHTWQLSKATLDTVRRLLDVAYEEDFAPEDWEHTLGGVHAMVWDGDELIGHGSVVQRRMLLQAPGEDVTRPGVALRAGYVEGVAVHADRRRQGIGAELMLALGDVIRGADSLGVLSAADEARTLYEAQGWLAWRGRTFAMTPSGIVRTEEEDPGIMVLPVEPLDLDGDLTCDWRDGDVW